MDHATFRMTNFKFHHILLKLLLTHLHQTEAFVDSNIHCRLQIQMIQPENSNKSHANTIKTTLTVDNEQRKGEGWIPFNIINDDNNNNDNSYNIITVRNTVYYT